MRLCLTGEKEVLVGIELWSIFEADSRSSLDYLTGAKHVLVDRST